MRIAYVINSLEGGGAAAPVPAVTRVLRDQGAEVEVFALLPRDRRALAGMEADGLVVHVREGREKDHLAALTWLDRQIAAFQPDLIWTSLTRATLLGQLVGLRRRLPVVSWQHAAFLKPANRILLRNAQRLSQLWIGDSNNVTCLTARRLGVPPERLTTWPLFAANGAAPVAKPWSPGQTVELGSLGRLHRVKGYDVLIEALAILKASHFAPPAPFRVRIAGDGAQRASLAARIAAAGLDNVELVGFQEQPRAFLASLHGYLQPSRSEGLCIAAHEAMEAALPMVVSAAGEMPFSVLDERTGFVVAPDDPEALAEALRRLLSHPERLAAMGQASRERVLERFGAARFARTGAEIYGRLPLSRAKLRGRGPHRSAVRPASGRSA
ncbi:glycosyltransferase family 4 protein [Caulobacter sp.]|uniref:glycosyltransferase family 4 protein n=1 Tax=Caulobacter sp. TaxID=78 RepID=UPI002B48438F|nr:glycosyltransferase family 4 protein [Caulobacter sp.]HJV42437.1 glycosyltransferase family 4 protein [Caulobacter sp.]